MTLARRLENAAYERFNNDRRKAIKYLEDQALFYVYKAHSKIGTKYHQQWRAIYQGYSSAAYAAAYWLSVREEEYDEPLYYEPAPLG